MKKLLHVTLFVIICSSFTVKAEQRVLLSSELSKIELDIVKASIEQKYNVKLDFLKLKTRKGQAGYLYKLSRDISPQLFKSLGKEKYKKVKLKAFDIEPSLLMSDDKRVNKANGRVSR